MKRLGGEVGKWKGKKHDKMGGKTYNILIRIPRKFSLFLINSSRLKDGENAGKWAGEMGKAATSSRRSAEKVFLWWVWI